MRLLLIDTSTERGVIGFSDHGVLLMARELPYGLNQSKFLMPYLAESLKPYGFPPASLNAIGVGVGPGSYTGIRLGVAAAQALAYSWKVPLVGFSSLDGFLPDDHSVHFAAILDARIGGVYLQTGFRDFEGHCQRGSPLVCPVEELGIFVEQTTHFVTPALKSLQTKVGLCYPDRKWIWEERPPSIQQIVWSVEKLYNEGKAVAPPDRLQLHYLRKTEAEQRSNSR